MEILYVVQGLIIYNFFVFLFGMINTKEEIKKYMLMTFSVIYNGFIGYIDTYVFLFLYGYFSNMPKREWILCSRV